MHHIWHLWAKYTKFIALKSELQLHIAHRVYGVHYIETLHAV